MRSQLERILSLLYRRERRCMDCLGKLKKGSDGKARISPREAAEELFKNETLEDQILCFLLLVSLGNRLVSEVIEDLGNRGEGAISIDEALLILGDELDSLCQRARVQAIMAIEEARKNKMKAPI